MHISENKNGHICIEQNVKTIYNAIHITCTLHMFLQY